MFNPERGERGCHPPRRLEVSVDTGGSRGINAATDLERRVKFGPCTRDNGVKDFPDSSSNGVPSTRIESRPRLGGMLGEFHGSGPRRIRTPLSTQASWGVRVP